MKYLGIDAYSGAKIYKRGACIILHGIEPRGDDNILLHHISISCKDRYPTWDEIKWARYELAPPNKTMVMILPPKSEYVNVHENCFHLWEER